VKTRARREGDEWLITGQKVWTSYAHLATHIFVLCRTGQGSTRHAGLSLLLCELDQPGVTIRPLRTMTGDHEFNEVFFENARCPAEAVVGDVGQGWTVAMTLLGFERGEAAAVLPIKFAKDLERLVALAQDRGI